MLSGKSAKSGKNRYHPFFESKPLTLKDIVKNLDVTTTKFHEDAVVNKAETSSVQKKIAATKLAECMLSAAKTLETTLKQLESKSVSESECLLIKRINGYADMAESYFRKAKDDKLTKGIDHAGSKLNSILIKIFNKPNWPKSDQKEEEKKEYRK